MTTTKLRLIIYFTKLVALFICGCIGKVWTFTFSVSYNLYFICRHFFSVSLEELTAVHSYNSLHCFQVWSSVSPAEHDGTGSLLMEECVCMCSPDKNIEEKQHCWYRITALRLSLLVSLVSHLVIHSHTAV